MNPQARDRAVEDLPSWMPEEEASPPEGDGHSDARFGAREALRGFFANNARGVYVGSDLIVYYPGTRRFAPDLLVAFDVEPGPREKWVVSAEGKGLDFVLEVLYAGDRAKDLRDNVAFYARLGIPEYFVYDRARQRLHGFRLASPDAGRYVPAVPQAGRYASEILGLDLTIEDDKLRFYHATARVLEPNELLERIQQTLDQVEARLAHEERLREEEQRLREEAEQRLEAALAELERLERDR